jgi:hypothetical protein
VTAISMLNWGSVPDWLSGSGALLALLFAFLAVQSSQRTALLQAQGLDTIERDRQQVQASKVAAWIITDDHGEHICRVRNSSDLPVVNCHIFVHNRSQGEPGEQGERYWRRLQVFVLPPGTVDRTVGQIPFPAPAGELTYTPLRVALIFEDSNSRNWQRDIRGRLKEISFSCALEIYLATEDTWTRPDNLPDIDRRFRPLDPDEQTSSV